MKRLILLFLLSGCVHIRPQAQTSVYIIDNGIVKRSVNTANNHVLGESYVMLENNAEFVRGKNKEFSLYVNDQEYTGFSEWKNISKRDTLTAKGGKGFVLSFESTSKTPFSVELQYIAYPDLAAIHKSMRVINNGNQEIKIENVDVEAFNVNWSTHQSRIYHYYGRRVWVGPYVGDWNDPLVILHSLDGRRGLAVGNEAIGVTKRTALLEEEASVSARIYPDSVSPAKVFGTAFAVSIQSLAAEV